MAVRLDEVHTLPDGEVYQHDEYVFVARDWENWAITLLRSTSGDGEVIDLGQAGYTKVWADGRLAMGYLGDTREEGDPTTVEEWEAWEELTWTYPDLLAELSDEKILARMAGFSEATDRGVDYTSREQIARQGAPLPTFSFNHLWIERRGGEAYVEESIASQEQHGTTGVLPLEGSTSGEELTGLVEVHTTEVPCDDCRADQAISRVELRDPVSGMAALSEIDYPDPASDARIVVTHVMDASPELIDEILFRSSP